MSTTTPTVAHVTGPRPENEHFADDGSYESVRRLLHNQAGKCFARVSALGLGMTFDDVLQEMNLSYVRALEKWSPDRGIRFSTYLTTCCRQNFNERIFKPARERRVLGMVNMTDMHRTSSSDMGDDMPDPMETFGQDNTEVSIPMDLFPFELDSAAGPEDRTGEIYGDPMEILERKQNAAKNLRSIRKLTDVSRDYVVALIKAAREGEELPVMRDMALSRNMDKTGLQRMRVEISRRFAAK